MKLLAITDAKDIKTVLEIIRAIMVSQILLLCNLMGCVKNIQFEKLSPDKESYTDKTNNFNKSLEDF